MKYLAVNFDHIIGVVNGMNSGLGTCSFTQDA